MLHIRYIIQIALLAHMFAYFYIVFLFFNFFSCYSVMHFVIVILHTVFNVVT